MGDWCGPEIRHRLIENRGALIRDHQSRELIKENKEILTGTSVPLDTCLLMGDPSGDLQMTKFQLFQTFNLNTAASSNRSKRSTASLSSNRLKKQSGDFRNSGIPKGSMLVGSNWSWQFRVRREGQASFSGRSRRKAGGKLDGGVLPLLMSIARTGSTETRRWR
jgi:hypothetical protein